LGLLLTEVWGFSVTGFEATVHRATFFSAGNWQFLEKRAVNQRLFSFF